MGKNRDTKMQPKLGAGWCQCDRDFVAHYAKCQNCGRRNGRYRFKKPAPEYDE